MTDWKSLPTPYRIPGPAGGLDWYDERATASNKRQLSRNGRNVLSSPSASVPDNSAKFRGGAWCCALCELGVITQAKQRDDADKTNSQTSKLLLESVALLQARSLTEDVYKAERLLVEIDSLCRVGKDASVVLADPTGKIAGTLHSSVLDSHKESIRPGSVLVLIRITAIAHESSRAIGFRSDPSAGVHVSIHLSNVERVFTVQENGTHTIDAPLLCYDPRARNPSVTPRKGADRKRLPCMQPSRAGHIPARSARREPLSKNAALGQRLNQRSSTNSRFPQRQLAPCQPRIAESLSNSCPQTHFAKHQLALERPEMALRSRSSVSSFANSTTLTPMQVADINDELLDDILGNVDIDAAIAASGKGSIVASNSRQPSSQDSANPDRSYYATSFAANGTSHDHTNASAVQQDAMSSAQGKLSLTDEVDDDIIANLMEGLDGDDFAEF